MNAPTRPTEANSQVIFLNGSSSAGKTSIAKVLQRILDEPALHITLDSFIGMLPEHRVFDQARETEAFFRMIAGFHPPRGHGDDAQVNGMSAGIAAVIPSQRAVQ